MTDSDGYVLRLLDDAEESFAAAEHYERELERLPWWAFSERFDAKDWLRFHRRRAAACWSAAAESGR